MISLEDVLNHDIIRLIAVTKQLDHSTQLPTDATEKTYTALMKALSEEGVELGVNGQKYDGKKIVIELTSSHNPVTSITSVAFVRKSNDNKTYSPYELVCLTDASLTVIENNVFIYRHKVLPYGVKVVI